MQKHRKKLAHTVRRVASNIRRVVRSKWFFIFIVAVFTLQALWLIWSVAFSAAYDEYYHYGLIREYAHSLSPFIGQPAGPAELGAVARDPSFLFAYGMSFPYRLLALFTDNLVLHVMALRTICLLFFVGSLVVFRRVLLRAGLSPILTNLGLFVITLLPTSVMLASQINYDNAMLLITAVSLYFAQRFLTMLQNNQALPYTQIIALAASLMAGSIVKFSFLPIALAIALYVGTVGVHRLWQFKTKPALFRSSLRQAVRTVPFWVAATGFVLSGFLFAERVGGNMLQYGTPAPDCAVVLSLEQCKAYDPYGRNMRFIDEGYAQGMDETALHYYANDWYDAMLEEAFIVVGPRQFDYPYMAALPFGFYAGRILLAISLIAILLSLPLLLKKGAFYQLCLLVIVLYMGILYLHNYSEFKEYGVQIAVHARYALPILPLVVLLAASGLQDLLRSRSQKIAGAVLASVLLSMLVLGGGALPYVLRSSDDWIWAHAQNANRVVRSALWEKVPL